MATQGTLEYAIRNLLRAKFSDALDAEGITEKGMRVPPGLQGGMAGGVAGVGSVFKTGIDAVAVDEDHVGGMGAIRIGSRYGLPPAIPPPRKGTALRVAKPSGLVARFWKRFVGPGEVFKELAAKKAEKGETTVRKGEIMRAAEPEIEKMAGQMATALRQGTRSQIQAARAGVFGPKAKAAVAGAAGRERIAERKAYDLPSADASDPRAESDADSFFTYPEQDWDMLRMPKPIVRRPATAGQATAAAIEGTRRVITELKKHGDPVLAAEALDKMDMKAPAPGVPAVTAGEEARVQIQRGLAEKGISLPNRPEVVRAMRRGFRF